MVDSDWRTFADRRIIHFVYFYLLWLTVQFAFKAPAFAAEIGVAETAKLYLLALTIEPFGTLWFIWILPFFALTVRLTRRVPVPAMLAVAALIEIAPIETGYLAIDEFASRFVYFYVGYALAPLVFRFADTLAEHRAPALAGLAAWAMVNGLVVWSGWSHAPVVSLVLGLFGAMAVVATAVLVGGIARIGDVARMVGSRSLIVYLGFFLPMVVTREILVRTDLVTDVGLVSLIVTVTAAVVPFLMWRVALLLGLTFFYERPRWARLSSPRRPMVLQAAE